MMRLTIETTPGTHRTVNSLQQALECYRQHGQMGRTSNLMLGGTLIGFVRSPVDAVKLGGSPLDDSDPVLGPYATARPAPAITPLTAQQAAEFVWRLTGGKPNPDITAASYRDSAATNRAAEGKARASKKGIYRGLGASQWAASAERLERYAVEVPALLRDMGGFRFHGG